MQSHEELEEMNGQATVYTVTNKETGEVFETEKYGSDENANTFVHLLDGTVVTFINGENETYTLNEVL